MNIFLFDRDLKTNAQYFKNKDTKRFNKQIVESTQLFAACMLHYHNIKVIKKDNTPYIVNRILHHPACKWLIKDIKNHHWHINYLGELLNISPMHACNISYNNALLMLAVVPKNQYYLDEYLCITNSDMSGLNNPTVFDKYKRHLQNKHKKIDNQVLL